MVRLIAIMNGKTDLNDRSDDPISVNKPKLNIDPGISAMKTILEAFSRGANIAAEHLVDEAEEDGPLREAMVMQPTDTGVVIGNWAIITKTESGRTLYDVMHVNESVPIATDLTIYEAARGLARALHDRISITSKPVRDLLKLEEEFANAAHDAIHARYALRKQKLTESKRALIEDKYGAAVRRAQNARSRLNALVTRSPFQ
ncbi:unnamed protein product [Sphagnum tenellum]